MRVLFILVVVLCNAGLIFAGNKKTVDNEASGNDVTMIINTPALTGFYTVGNDSGGSYPLNQTNYVPRDKSQSISRRLEPAIPLRNPDRGFHLESNYFVHNYINPFNRSETYPGGFVDERLKQFGAEKDSITLTQLYLSSYVDQDIPQEAFERMQAIFDNLKAKGFKAILRFAYNYTGLNTSGGETETIISRHLEQLRPFLRKNLGLIATCQVGFIGAWGEWHNSPLSKNQEAKNKLVNTLLDIFPKEYCLQMRYPRDKELLTLDHPDDWKRIGFSNDYFTAGEHSHVPENDFVPGDKNFEMVLKDASVFL